MNTLFPVFLKTDQLNFLIVGGGKTALDKLQFLYKSSPGTKLTLVAIEISQEVFDQVRLFPGAEIFQRGFSVEDLADKHIVIAATHNPALNESLRKLADKYRFLLNVADQPAYCDFYLGGIVTRGELKVAVSTNGKSPVLAKRLRQTFEEILPPSIEETIELTHELRKKLHGSFEEKLKKLNELTAGLIN